MVLEKQRIGEGERTREVQEEEEINTRLVDADELMANITAGCKNCNRRKNSQGRIVYEIGDAPCRSCGIYDAIEWICAAGEVDAVPVVRCKDCRYSDDYYNDGSCYCKHPEREMLYIGTNWNWYCADGERKDKE